jgi:hypothetical protein
MLKITAGLAADAEERRPSKLQLPSHLPARELRKNCDGAVRIYSGHVPHQWRICMPVTSRIWLLPS